MNPVEQNISLTEEDYNGVILTSISILVGARLEDLANTTSTVEGGATNQMFYAHITTWLGRWLCTKL